MIYFDNAATSFPKPKDVIQATNECITKYCGNPGRSSHKLSLKSAEKIFESRESVMKFIGAESEENIIFTQNATHALNHAIKGLVPNDSHCIISDLEHNSVLRPINTLTKENGVEFTVFDSSLPLRKAIIPSITEKTSTIVTSIASNVTGKVLNLKELSDIAREFSLKLIVDASQHIGHKEINLKNTPVDALCAPGHKALFGIQGSGFLYMKNTPNIKTLIEGGTGSNSFSEEMPEYLPDRLEAGTLSTPAIVSLGSGIEYIKSYGMEQIEKYINNLTRYAEEVLSSFMDIEVYGAENGIVSFNKKKTPSFDMAKILEKYNIASRGGIHCAPLIHKKLGTENTGAVRISFSIHNSIKDIDKLFLAIKKG